MSQSRRDRQIASEQERRMAWVIRKNWHRTAEDRDSTGWHKREITPVSR